MNNKRIEYSINRRGEPKFWNNNSQKIKGKTREAVQTNDHINNLKHKLHKIHQRMIDDDQISQLNQ